jgi:hypothetical protein
LTVQGNHIGTDPTGTKAVANVYGINVGGSNSTIGGTTTGAGNVISGNNYGVYIAGAVSGVAVQGNYIGTDATGANGLGSMGFGIDDQGSTNTIGGTTFAARNYISGNTGAGVKLDSAAGGNVVEGNFLGVDFTGKVALGNGYGVSIASSNNTVGGVASGAGNKIADNTTAGILVSAGSGDSIRQNAVYANGPSNTGPGIVLSAGANNNLAPPTSAPPASAAAR